MDMLQRFWTTVKDAPAMDLAWFFSGLWLIVLFLGAIIVQVFKSFSKKNKKFKMPDE